MISNNPFLEQFSSHKSGTVNSLIDQNDSLGKGFLNPQMNPNLNPMANPNINPQMNPNLNPMANPNINPMVNPNINPFASPEDAERKF